MERHFDTELKELHDELLKMGMMAEEAIARSMESLMDGNVTLAEQVVTNDTMVDELELSIQNRCLVLLAIRQPLAVDLRYIATAMSINGELERIADIASDIAKRVIELSDKPLLKPLVDLPKLSAIAQSMVRNAVDSFVNRDIALAKKVISSEPETDEIRNRIQDELINDYMAKDPSTSPKAVPLLLIARYLERICDHATNIAEDVIYIVQGRVVRHHLDKLQENGDATT